MSTLPPSVPWERAMPITIRNEVGEASESRFHTPAALRIGEQWTSLIPERRDSGGFYVLRGEGQLVRALINTCSDPTRAGYREFPSASSSISGDNRPNPNCKRELLCERIPLVTPRQSSYNLHRRISIGNFDNCRHISLPSGGRRESTPTPGGLSGCTSSTR